jgi:6-pyruvoyltetrahydropterin/6-carboxytetrahydropterin synthase
MYSHLNVADVSTGFDRRHCGTPHVRATLPESPSHACAAGASGSCGAQLVVTMEQLTTIELSKEDTKFSAAHFTIFSATERERLHGHNFAVRLAVTAPVGPDGICFSYGEIKEKLRALCAAIDEYTLIPALSPHLIIEDDGDYHVVIFNGERMPLLKSDTLLLPIRNSTVEEYARYLLEQFLADHAFNWQRDIRRLEVSVSSGPGQWGNCVWHAPEK